MRRFVAPASVALLAAVSLAACSGDDAPAAPRAFCDAVVDLEDGFVDLFDEPRDVQIRGQIELVEEVVDTAPREIEPDARTFLEALEAIRDDPDNDALRDDPEVEEAVANVERYAIDGCGLYEDDSGSPL
jgi:hypothetical protein